tara:strand:+ start:1710 stop:1886 length:177 start_codon:yes stop_codon:yes gene_type:complete
MLLGGDDSGSPEKASNEDIIKALFAELPPRNHEDHPAGSSQPGFLRGQIELPEEWPSG